MCTSPSHHRSWRITQQSQHRCLRRSPKSTFLCNKLTSAQSWHARVRQSRGVSSGLVDSGAINSATSVMPTFLEPCHQFSRQIPTTDRPVLTLTRPLAPTSYTTPYYSPPPVILIKLYISTILPSALKADLNSKMSHLTLARPSKSIELRYSSVPKIILFD
jgi:hypothetical protein